MPARDRPSPPGCGRGRDVEVYGTLWLARRLVDEGCLDVDELELAYVQMKAARRRLPWAKVEEQLEDLRGG